MPTTEKEIESCGRMINIPIFIITFILLITSIIELYSRNDNLFLLILTITVTIFLTCLFSLYMFSDCLSNMKCIISNKQNNDEHELENIVIEP